MHDVQGVRNAFGVYGSIRNVRLVRDRTNNAFRGFGFVEFDSEGAAVGAIDQDGQFLLGRKVTVRFARNSGSRQKAISKTISKTVGSFFLHYTQRL